MAPLRNFSVYGQHFASLRNFSVYGQHFASLKNFSVFGQQIASASLFSRSVFTWGIGHPNLHTRPSLTHRLPKRILHIDTSTILGPPKHLFSNTNRSVNIYKLRYGQPYSQRHMHGMSKYGFNSTIFSLSSGHGKCGVAVIRISGSKVKVVIKQMIPKDVHLPPRKAVLCKIIDPASQGTIDKGLVLYFPGPYSFTGEDSLEFQVHGGPAVISSLLAALHNIPDCKQAEPGEFTKRAFLNGKLDLTEVEGLGDLIHAETEVQRKQALRQMDGDLSELYSRWRTSVIKCVADLEAFIDFSEDQHIEEHVVHRVCEMVEKLRNEIRQHVNDKRKGERLREGVHVTILGEPNVGKSSLLNTICQRPAAIVTEIAGTTRDIIETPVNLDGYPMLLSDTAGLRQTQDVVEKEGVTRAINRAKTSDIRIFMFDIGKDILNNRLEMKLNSIDLKKHISAFLERFYKDEQIQTASEQSPHGKVLQDRRTVSGIVEEADGNASNGIVIGDLISDNNRGSNISEMVNETEDITIECDNTIIVLNKIDLLPPDMGQNLTEDMRMIDNQTSGEMYRKKNAHSIKLDREEDTMKLHNTGDKMQQLRESLKASLIKHPPDHFQGSHDKIQTLGDASFVSDTSLQQNAYSSLLQCEGDTDSVVTDDSNTSARQMFSTEDLTVCCISCVTKEGLENFIDVLRDKVAGMCGNPLAGHPSITQTRHRSHLIKCLENLDQFDHMIASDDIVLASEYLRRALREVGKITGNISSEEILDVIFKDFCIGK